MFSTVLILLLLVLLVLLILRRLTAHQVLDLASDHFQIVFRVLILWGALQGFFIILDALLQFLDIVLHGSARRTLAPGRGATVTVLGSRGTHARNRAPVPG